MFILNIESINHKCDLFFNDPQNNNPSSQEFVYSLVKKLPNAFINDNLNLETNRSFKESCWVMNNMFYYFKTIQDAEQFAYIMSTDQSEHRSIIRTWNKTNDILSKFYISDINGNLIKTLTDCEQGICIRFNGACSTESGCSTIELAKSLKNKKIIPILSS